MHAVSDCITACSALPVGDSEGGWIHGSVPRGVRDAVFETASAGQRAVVKPQLTDRSPGIILPRLLLLLLLLLTREKLELSSSLEVQMIDRMRRGERQCLETQRPLGDTEDEAAASPYSMQLHCCI